MQIPRFFIDSESINESSSSARISDAKLIHQIGRVLRLGTGAPVILLNGKGDLFHCRIEKQDRDSTSLCIERKESEPEDETCGLTVGMPLIKPSRFEWGLEKLTELGATTIIPIVTQRTILKSSDLSEDGKKKDNKGNNVKKERWHSIVKEAAEQSERYAIPKVVAPQNFADYVKNIDALCEPERYGKALHYILAERNSCAHLSMHLLQAKKEGRSTRNITLCLGPEGGFTDAEISLAAETSLTLASLGKTIFRSETAAISAASIIGALRNP